MGTIMPKALLVLFGFAAIGACVLQQRQTALELRYQSAQMHRQIQKAQGQLWRQQLQIAEYTSPQVMQTMVGGASATKLPVMENDSVKE